MYNGIGLTTPRGSGTNGHIQSNKFFVRPKSTTGKDTEGHGPGAGLLRNPNKDILEHDRKRQIELKLVVLEDKLSDQGYTDSDIAEARKNLEVAEALEASRETGEFTPLSVSDVKMDPQSSVEEAILMFQSSEPARGRDLFNEMVRVCSNNTDVWIQFLDQEIRLGDKRTIRALFHRATSLMLTPEKMMILFEKYRTYEKSLGDKGRPRHVDEQLMKYLTSPLPYEDWEIGIIERWKKKHAHLQR